MQATMSDYTLLDQANEDALHKKRLLNVEEKPFKRITKRLLTSDLVNKPPTELIAHSGDSLEQTNKWMHFRDDLALDFAAFQSSLARIQFLLTSNQLERMRYAEEKLRIERTAQAVKDNSADLRVQLAEAQKSLALRKTYDELSDKITSNRLLRPRDQQQVRLENLNAEIAKLEQEREEYAKTWAERREQFGRIVEEGLQLRRLIRDEKEEVERREGMEDADDVEIVDVVPLRGHGAHQSDHLKPGEHTGQLSSRLTPAQMSTTASPAPTVKGTQTNDDEDENMLDEGEITSDERSHDYEQRATGARLDDKMDIA